jgi:hypothetical protein
MQISSDILLGISAFVLPALFYFIVDRLFSERVAAFSLLFGVPFVFMVTRMILGPSNFSSAIFIYAALQRPLVRF